MRKLKCPRCRQKHGLKAIYYGVKVNLCSSNYCNCVWGLGARLTDWLPFNGVFMVYTGSYWAALWYWLKGCPDE